MAPSSLSTLATALKQGSAGLADSPCTTAVPATGTTPASGRGEEPGPGPATFERRGLSAWDVFWRASRADLHRRVLSVHDVSGGERRLVARAVLHDGYKVEQPTPTELRLTPAEAADGSAPGDFRFTWRFDDQEQAERWAMHLAHLCRAGPPRRPPSGSGAEEAQEEDDLPEDAAAAAAQAAAARREPSEEGLLASVVSHPALLASALLAPGLGGPALLADFAISAFSSLLSQDNSQEGVPTEESLAALAMAMEAESDTTASSKGLLLASEAARLWDVSPCGPAADEQLVGPPALAGAQAQVPAEDVHKVSPITTKERPLQRSRRAFAGALLWDADLDARRFAEACSGLCAIMLTTGAWAAPLVEEVQQQAASVQAAARGGLGPSLRELVQSLLAQDAADAGETVRGLAKSLGSLSLWSSALRTCALAGPEVPQGTFRQSILAAAEAHLQLGSRATRSWISDDAVIPEWEEASAGLAASPRALRGDIGAWVAALDEVLPRLEAALKGAPAPGADVESAL